MNPVPAYSVPLPVEKQGIGSNWSAPVQSLVSAALVIPTIPLWYLRLLPYERGWDDFLGGLWLVALTVVLDVYLVVLVTILARSSRRMVAALITAIVAAVVDVADTAMVTFASVTEALRWADRVLVVVSFVLSVAAWGIARRRNSLWLIGLALSLLIGIGLVALYQSDGLYNTLGDVWIVYWVLWVGGFLLCCAICWGIDAMASTSAKRATDPAGGRPR